MFGANHVLCKSIHHGSHETYFHIGIMEIAMNKDMISSQYQERKKGIPFMIFVINSS